MNKRPCSVLFLGKTKDQHVERALGFCKSHFIDVAAYLGNWGDPLPKGVLAWEGDCIISYLSRWVVPPSLLNTARIVAINFHPGPPAYPGIGCNSFALYEEATAYGVTCHHMAPRVDTGPIIKVNRFPIFETDTLDALIQRTYDFQLVLFYEIASLMLQNKPLPVSEERWARGPISRKEFDELGVIGLDMTKEEIAKRIRAMTCHVWKPSIELHGFAFELKAEQEN
jgi:methionyl-tRNA formyltransferase